MTTTNQPPRLGDSNENHFTKEYKSPQQSRFRMASFTEMVKNKSGSKQNSGAKVPNPKAKPRYTYLSSTMKKPKMKAVKRQEVDLQKKDESISK